MNKRRPTLLIVQTAGTNFSYHTLTLKLIDNCKYNTVDPRSMGTCLISTPLYNGQFRLSQQNLIRYVFSKINPLNTDAS